MIQSVHQNSSSRLEAFGSNEYPIDIMDDQEEKVFYDRLLERSRNVEIIKKAYLCKTSLQVTFAIVKTKFIGQLHAKELALKNEIARYFYDNIGVNIFSDFFLPKIEPDYSNEETKPLGIALMVYGVDFMDTRQIGNMFSIPNEGGKSLIHKITWINDSHCIVTFYSPQNTQLVLERLSRNLQNYKVKIQQEGVSDLPKRWFQIQPYSIYDVERSLYVRYITTLELDLQKTKELNRYVIFENAQKGLELYLLTKFNAFEEYDQIKQQIEFEKYRKSSFNQNRFFLNTPKILVDTPAFEQYVSQNQQISAVQGQNQPYGSNGQQNVSNIVSAPVQNPVDPLENGIIYGGASSVNNPPVESLQMNLDISIIGENVSNADVPMVDESVEELNRSLLSEIKHTNENMVNEDNGAIMIEQSSQVVVHQEKIPNREGQLINDDVIQMLQKNQTNISESMKKSNLSVKNKLSSQLISLNIAQTIETPAVAGKKGTATSNFNSTITAGTTILSVNDSEILEKAFIKSTIQNTNNERNKSIMDKNKKMNQSHQQILASGKNNQTQVANNKPSAVQKPVDKQGEQKQALFEYDPYLLKIAKNNEQSKPNEKIQVNEEKEKPQVQNSEKIQEQRQSSNQARGRGRNVDAGKSKFQGYNNRPNQEESTTRGGSAQQGRNFYQESDKKGGKGNAREDDNNDSASY